MHRIALYVFHQKKFWVTPQTPLLLEPRIVSQSGLFSLQNLAGRLEQAHILLALSPSRP